MKRVCPAKTQMRVRSEKHSCGPTEALQQRQQNEQMFCLKRRLRASMVS